MAWLDFTALVGIVAGLCSMTSFAPQAWRIIRTRELAGLSGKMYAITVAAFAAWTTFGFLKGEWTIIVPNVVCLALSGFILAMILLPKREREEVLDKVDPG